MSATSGVEPVDGGFVNHDIAGLEDFTHGFAGLDQRREVGTLVLVNRRGYGDDEAVAAPQLVELRGKAQMTGSLQFFGFGLQRVVVTRLQLGNALFIDIKPDHGAFFAKLHR